MVAASLSDSQPDYVELPRPMRLLRTAGVSLAESFGLPTGGYALAAWLAGRSRSPISACASCSPARRAGIPRSPPGWPPR
jgi:hypothetical protein